MRPILLVALLLGVTTGCGSSASASATDLGGADVSDSGAIATDTSSDVSPDLGADAAADVAPADVSISPALQELVAKLAGADCLQQAMCCGKSVAGCTAAVSADLLKVDKISDLDAPIAAGEIVAGDNAACVKALQGASQGCDGAALERAASTCVHTFVDSAALNAECHVAAALPCGGGKGTCTLVLPPDGYKCLAGHAKGESCSATQPCITGLACLNTNLTRALVCGEPGSTCNLGDSCWSGFACASGVCKADNSGLAKDAPCKSGDTCAATLSCQSGACKPSLCEKQ